MRLALRLAAKAAGRTLPNPMVGAVITRGGRVIAGAYHSKAGRPHAETLALAKAGAAAKGGTLYVTLEPCSHTGRTPPCDEAVVRAGIRRVVTAMVDPDPRVRGRGIRRLRRAGLRVSVGLLERQARDLNGAFITRTAKERPFVTLKLAASLDGRIAAVGGEARWVSGPAARAWTRRLRSQNDAILVGVNTVLADDPRLTGRGDPVRVVLDSKLRTPRRARLFRSKTPVWLAASSGASRANEARLRKAGAEVLRFPAAGGRLNLKTVLKELARRGISRLLIEGGGEVAASALEARAVDKAVWVVAPKIFGGGVPAVAGRGVRSPSRAVRLEKTNVRRIGEDLILEGKVRFP